MAKAGAVISLKNGKPKAKRSWEELVSLGLGLREDKDKTQWQLGDLALQVEKDYGDDSLGKFSVEIGINKSTLATYRTCSGFYPKALRDKFARLGHAFFQTAMRNASIEMATDWLEEADNNNWSCEGLRIEMDDKKDETANKKMDKMFSAIDKLIETVVKKFEKSKSASAYLILMIKKLQETLKKAIVELAKGG